MKMLLPPASRRKLIDAHLSEFYDTYQKPNWDAALMLLAEFYEVDEPRIEWYEYIEGGKAAGKTWEDGTVHLQHPEDWKKSKSRMRGKRQWIDTVYHEFFHFLFWANPEEKAVEFARKFVRGLKRPAGT